jgi:hypothetical protein
MLRSDSSPQTNNPNERPCFIAGLKSRFMKKFNSILVSALMVITATVQGGTQPTPITSPQVITVPGYYILANDITSSSGFFAIVIQTSDVRLNLNGHTITSQSGGIEIAQFDTTGATVTDVRVTNGTIVASQLGIAISGSDCTVTRLNITVGQGGNATDITNGQFNHVADCVLIGGQPEQLIIASTAFFLLLASDNTIEDCTLEGAFFDTIVKQDVEVRALIVFGNNTFRGNRFANPIR